MPGRRIWPRQTAFQDLPRPAHNSGAYIERAAERIGFEALPRTIRLGELEVALPGAVPSVIQVSPRLFAALIGRTKRAFILLGPDLRRHRVPIAVLCRAIREPFTSPHRATVEEALGNPEFGSAGQSAIEAVLLDRVARISFRGCWILQPSPGASLRIWLRQAAVLRNAVALIGAHVAQYLIWLTAWAVLGRMSLSGRIDRGTLFGWALLLATAVPFQLMASWLQGLLAVGTGGLLKKRLLAGALKLKPDEVRESGIGSFLAQVLEAETVEQLALGGGVSGALALLDLCIAAALLGTHAVFLGIWFMVLLFAAWRFLRAFAAWIEGRFALTGTTTEAMLGHRTRLTQQAPSQWHRTEDLQLEAYHGLSGALDRAGVTLLSVIPRGWLILGLASTAPLLLTAGESTTSIAARIASVLLAYNAFSQLAGSFTELAAVIVGSRSLAELFSAAGRANTSGTLIEPPRANPGTNIVEADKLSFRYREHGSPVLEDCSLAIRPGDRVLLEGPSGGGKTTLASVLSGMREPASGLLLSGGLDKATLGSDGWSDRVISVPQFHENHILTESLAFNLLLGRHWPPSPADLHDADDVCRHLGLGDLLDRMPNGLMQMVGEGGWQLSHGEKTRIYMARALLQNSELLILDESFGALDPENMQRCLEYTLERANALMVIAHP